MHNPEKPQNPLLFNRELLRLRRDRAAKHYHEVDFLKKEAVERTIDRLDDIARDFPLVFELGSHTGQLAKALDTSSKIGRLIQADLSTHMISQASGERLVSDEEWLPFAPHCFDAAISVLNMHWINDLPGSLIRQALKPDGLFLACLPGANTLKELRNVLTDASVEIEGGLSPRVAPFVEVRDAGNLLMRAGFSLPVTDTETITITYPHAFKLMHELRMMGETNILYEQRAGFSSRKMLFRAAELYHQRYAGDDGTVPVTVELVFLTAWTPHESQQKPARRGSGQVSMTEILQ
jgi:SAM-dependent methyltransferase